MPIQAGVPGELVRWGGSSAWAGCIPPAPPPKSAPTARRHFSLGHRPRLPTQSSPRAEGPTHLPPLRPRPQIAAPIRRRRHRHARIPRHDGPAPHRTPPRPQRHRLHLPPLRPHRQPRRVNQPHQIAPLKFPAAMSRLRARLQLFSCMTCFTHCLQTSFTLFAF